jgi:hypothetical protein
MQVCQVKSPTPRFREDGHDCADDWSGAPTRIALSRDGEDIYDCVLLDHIPANPASRPSFGQDSTYTQYRITIMIPDVQCERCSLQLVNPMTDKISTAAPFNGKCQYREGSPSPWGLSGTVGARVRWLRVVNSGWPAGSQCQGLSGTMVRD